MYHIADLVALLDALAGSIGVQVLCGACARPAIGRRMISGTIFGIRPDQAQLSLLLGELVQEPQSAADRVARRVVAADDQQQQVP